MARILAVATALPAHRYSQKEITATIGPLLTSNTTKRAVLERLHAGSRVSSRHLAQPLERYLDPRSFTETNEVFVRVATNLATDCLTAALAEAKIDPVEVDYIMFTSVTGVSAPSIDALLVERLGLRSDVKRVPMYGLGCVAGAAGIARVNDYLVGHPDGVAVLVAVELCSLTFQRGDDSMANLVASGLFGDGAAAVVMVGSERARRESKSGLDVVDTRSALYPDSSEVIGFNLTESGFRIVLTERVTKVVEQYFRADTIAFLAANDRVIADIDHWVAHPGGPRVLETFADCLGLDAGALHASWDSLARVGNLSSVSVLHILAESISATRARGGLESWQSWRPGPGPGPRPGMGQGVGQHTLLFALGPGVSAELVLLCWSA
ncbi:MAG: type III polyketide synthase [Microbacteriaceae bacterium]|nr:type III polyketide synthase [Microbacteriaceae bacterium]